MNFNAIFTITMTMFLLQSGLIQANSIPMAGTEIDLNSCEEQLAKYRQFLLQAIISFEDVCDAALNHEPDVVGLTFLRNFKPIDQRSEIWSFFKLLMAQFDDVEFTNIIRNAVLERCRIKSQQKRNSVVLGKKQRFHSWGGKRSSHDLSGDLLASEFA